MISEVKGGDVGVDEMVLNGVALLFVIGSGCSRVGNVLML